MNLSVKQKFIERCQQLIESGEELKRTRRQFNRFSCVVDRELFYKWKNSTGNLIIKIAGPKSSYYTGPV